ncbi:hypothetical protein TPY_2796 [Sulfobacillus acidophilus TPY]|uniref:Uncharacterized protein n=1 Tax=Sulfobacillus acidophilus (strain ATCC 700253 / DSM 10332 / NAL) TaxID=679936 RepID=G8TTZ5_SULAD|nr:hypothetical protein TPY_2796 [Sulfobacillus acidophilus TPY]AEW04586.1 hypothetical protein Sulac_1086 [Sulfobacillus acidophilus DSM 10332]
MGEQLLMDHIIINGQEWFSHPEQSFKIRTAFICSRPLTINSVGNWSPYRQVTLYFAYAPNGLNGHAWWTIDVDVKQYTNFGAVLLGVAEIQDGRFSWSGTYPAFVRSKRLYVVLAITGEGQYGVLGEPFGWWMGPLRGIPESPDKAPR